MPNRNYIAGRKLEYDVIKFLEARDYMCFRSAGSHGMADVTAFSKHNNESDIDLSLMYLWVQCKYWTGTIGFVDTKPFVDAARDCGVLPVLADRHFRGPIVFLDLEHQRALFSIARPVIEKQVKGK